jgi:hypothetical protein
MNRKRTTVDKLLFGASARARRFPRKQNSASRRRPLFETLEQRLAFALSVNISLNEVLESGGQVAATVSRSGVDLSQPLTISIAWSDSSEVNSLTSVEIPANESSAPITLNIVNDALLDEDKLVTITASAAGFDPATDQILVLNDDRPGLRSGPIDDHVTLAPAAGGLYDVTQGPVKASSLPAPLAARFAQQYLFQTAGPNVVIQADEFVAIDPAKTYALRGWAKAGDEFGQRFDAANRQSFGFVSYDVDRLPIRAEHVLKFAGATDTTLAAPLNPGDMFIHLANGGGWSNAAGAPAESRGIAWYGYASGDGTNYANYTYTRNVALGGANGLWAAGGVSGNVIALAAPWSGPALAAGAAVRNTGVGDGANLTALDDAPVPGDWNWTQYAAVIGGGTAASGADDPVRFRPGTAYVKPIIIANQQGATNSFVSWRDVSVGEVAAGTTAAELALPVVDLSVDLPGDQRQTVRLSPGSPYALSDHFVRIDPTQNYALSMWTFNVTQQIEKSIGFASYDIDQRQIFPLHVAKHPLAIDTTLASALTPGATSILLTNASGWSNDAWDAAESRSLAWYGYADSMGHVYADYTYTRHVAFDFDNGLWSPGGISYDAVAGAYRIELNQPWSGPALPAGAAIRNATGGEVYNLPIPAMTFDKVRDWASYAVTIGGVWQAGLRNESGFAPGTAYIRPLFYGQASYGWEFINELTIGPAGDAAYGTATDPTKQSLELTAGQQATVDLDVLSKNAFGLGALASIESVSALDGVATVVAAGPNGRDVIRFIAPAGFLGVTRIDYTLRDIATNETRQGSVVVTVLGGVLQAVGPLSANVRYQWYDVLAGQTLKGDNAHAPRLLTNVSGPANASTIRLTGAPTNGTLRLQPNGSFEYTPNPGFYGIDQIRYEALTTNGVVAATASINVIPTAEKFLLHQLRSVGQGMINYESDRRQFPVGRVSGVLQNTALSWRVHILPYIGYQALYDQFKLNEPWNSPSNLALLDKMPDLYRAPGEVGGNSTRFQLISGVGTEYFIRTATLEGPKRSHFTDGLANSLLVVFAGADKAALWTQPDDLEFDPANPLAAVGEIASTGIAAVLADGRTIVIPPTIDPATFKGLVTIAGGELIDADELRRQFAEASGDETAAYSFGKAQGAWAFKQIWLAMANYESTNRRYPIVGGPEIFDDAGRPYLSWRVHLLPYLGFQSLYNRFHFNEPWDSPNNLPLLAEMPDVFRSADDPSDSTSTRIVTFTGPDAPFERNTGGGDQTGPSYNAFTDGQQNTILFLEAGSDIAIPWTKPEDAPLDRNDPFAALGDMSSGEFRVAFADGSVASLSSDIASKVLAALATIKQGHDPSSYDTEELYSGQAIVDRELERAGLNESATARINNLKQVVLGMLNHESAQNRFPTNRLGTAGQSLLSWRVMILPYIGHASLFRKFRLDEAWDSPHNIELLKYMPDILRTPGDSWDSVMTRVLTFSGAGTPFPGTSNSGPTQASITGGTSNTIAVVQAGAENAVPWTKPADLAFNGNNPYSSIGELGSYLTAAMFDGSVWSHFIPETTPAQLYAYITPGTATGASSPSGRTVFHTGRDTTMGEFGADSLYVVLNVKPTANVTVNVSSGNPSLATVSQSQLVFTPANWNKPQRIIVRAIDDHVFNADRTVNILIGGTPYAALIRNDESAPPLAGDFDGNLVVDGADFLAWQRNFGATGATRAQGDADADGVIGANDLLGWKQTFGVPGGPQPIAALADTPVAAAVVAPLAARDAALRIHTSLAAKTLPVDEFALPFMDGLAPAAGWHLGSTEWSAVIEKRRGARIEAFAGYRIEGSVANSSGDHVRRQNLISRSGAALADPSNGNSPDEHDLLDRCFEQLACSLGEKIDTGFTGRDIQL